MQSRSRAARVRQSITDRPSGGGADRPAILLIDDEPDSLEMMRVWLTVQGFDVLAAASGPEGLLRIGERRPDLAIVDVMMPGMSGLELCAYLRGLPATQDLPILLCSAHQMPPHSNDGLYDYAILKPVDLPELMRAIRALVPAARRHRPEVHPAPE